MTKALYQCLYQFFYIRHFTSILGKQDNLLLNPLKYIVSILVAEPKKLCGFWRVPIDWYAATYSPPRVVAGCATPHRLLTAFRHQRVGYHPPLVWTVGPG